jgi:hypothetical protein
LSTVYNSRKLIDILISLIGGEFLFYSMVDLMSSKNGEIISIAVSIPFTLKDKI